MNTKPLPAQVELMIESMLNSTEREDVRQNYMNSLLNIRDAIDSSVSKYQRESGFRMKNNETPKR